MNELEIFRNPEFGEVRTMVIENEPYFVGKDIAEILGYANSSKAVINHVDIEDKRKEMLRADNQKGNVVTETTLINESGLYSLILSSKLPEAKRFKRWITSEVIPSIRKNGGYIANQENLTDDELLTRAVLVAQKKIAERDERIKALETDTQRMRPKEIFADAVATSKTSILVGEMAKLLKQNGVDTGQNKFFDYLRDNGYLIKRKGVDRNMPTQKSLELGLFEIKEGTVQNPDGSVRITKTPKVTGKGQQYFVNKFLGAQKVIMT